MLGALLSEVYETPLTGSANGTNEATGPKKRKKKKRVQFAEPETNPPPRQALGAPSDSCPQGYDGMPNAGYGDRLIFPLSPQEMATELLGSDEAQTVNPYCESSREYQGIPQSSYAMNNEHTQMQSIGPYAKPMRRLGPHPNQRSSHTNESNHRITELSDDPEYLEFLRYKRYVHSDRGPDSGQGPDSESGIEGFSGSQTTLTSPNEQFNELLLYLFTGFFLLMLYDNIYKLGRDAY